MGRARVILQSQYPYNLSARCINREWFQVPLERVWEIFCEEINRTTGDHEWNVHSFVLMSNHFHMIATTPHANISTCMQQFMTKTSLRLTKEGNRINETFAGRHFKCILQHPNYYLNAYKYNYRNPVAAGICEKVEDYPFSTLRGLLRPSEAKILILEDLTFTSDPSGTIQWLNTAPSTAMAEGVRFGLKHQVFTSKKCRNTNRPIISENDIL